MPDTLLTVPNKPEVEAAIRARELAAERAYVLLFEALLQGYKVGDIDFKSMLEQSRITLIDLGISEQGRKGFLGRLVDAALEMPAPAPRKGKRGPPVALQKLAVAMLDLADLDGYPFALSSSYKHEKVTAYTFVSQIFAGYGFSITENQLAKWRSVAR